MKKLFFFGATLLLSTLSAGAVNFLVQTGEDSDPKWDQSVIDATGATLIDLKTQNQTIDAALTAAITANKQEIWFAGGTYTFAAAYVNKNGTQFVGGFAGTETTKDARALKANGEAYDFQYETILDGDKKVQLFSTAGAANTTLDGLIIKNSVSTGSAGVVRLGTGAVVKNCQFIDNTASNQGGAIQFYNGGGAISNCYFEGNKGAQGGAIYANNSTTELVVENCAFINNSASLTTNAGGAIHAQNAGKVTIQNCYFTENTAIGNGAAISFAGTNDANTIQNCLIYKNDCAKTAVYMAAGNFYYNTVVENQSGAVYATKGEFKNNVFWATEKAKAQLSVNNANCKLDHNAAVDSLNSADGAAVVTNHIALSMENTGTEADVHYPKFANVESGDFELQEGSALINAGVMIDGITTDMVGETRSQADLGAFAYIASAPTNIDEAKNNTVDIEAALRAGEVYDIMGRRVGELQAGHIYLVEGAKVIMN